MYGAKTSDWTLKNGKSLDSGDGCFVLHAEQWLPLKVEALFPFYADENNLEIITPPWLHFHVMGKNTLKMTEGTLIDYRLRVRGVPLRWRSRIEEWRPNERFVDTQVRGPYGLWHHTHLFESVRGGTLVTDRVRYKVPGGALGRWLIGAFVSSDVRRIFEYRRKVISALFPVLETHA